MNQRHEFTTRNVSPVPRSGAAPQKQRAPQESRPVAADPSAARCRRRATCCRLVSYWQIGAFTPLAFTPPAFAPLAIKPAAERILPKTQFEFCLFLT